jgi:hypothetical protein
VNIELAQQPGGRAGDVLAQAAVQRFPLGRQVDVCAAADEPLSFKPGEELAGGVRVEIPRALELLAQRLTGKRGPTGGDQLEGLPGLGLGAALGEMLAQRDGQCLLGEGQGLAELAEDGRWCGHGGLRSSKIDRYLSTVTQ